jgi:thiamine biosynthesis lipoprotein
MPRAHEWSALGTYAQLVVDDQVDDGAAITIAKQLVEAIDATCSRFRPDSDLSRASAAAGRWVSVDPLLVQAVEAALEAARATDGLVDPTLGRALVDLGYDRDLELIRAETSSRASQPVPRRPDRDSDHVTSSAAAIGRWREVETDPAGWIRVPEGCALDLGATGKAFAADLVAGAVERAVGGSVVISLGGDVAAICGAERAAWPVLVSDTAGPGMDVPGQTIMLGTGGLATSSIRHRWWSHDGDVVHHILDPRTGRPAMTTVASATVRAASCVAANAASTAAVILGSAAPAWLEQRGLAAVLVDQDGRSTTYGGWPASARPRERATGRLDISC